MAFSGMICQGTMPSAAAFLPAPPGSWTGSASTTGDFRKQPASKLDEALSAADPKRTVLVFPSAYINSPASMFGHTLLRVDNSYQSELLAYAVNYSAVADNETNGFAYAFKGIFGLYPGYYSVSPYYEKVKEYNDIEHRDIWEYHLTLTEDETRRLVLHVWELQGIYSDYYFFDENCSYNVLYLLESARPTLNLTDRLPLWVIPSDTIRVVRDSGLVSSVRYRPSQGTRIRHLASFLAPDDQLAALAIANGRTTPESVRETSRPASGPGAHPGVGGRVPPVPVFPQRTGKRRLQPNVSFNAQRAEPSGPDGRKRTSRTGADTA